MLVLHVHSPTRAPQPPFDGHLVRNLLWSRFDPADLDDTVDVLVLSADDPHHAQQLLPAVRSHRPILPVVIRRAADTGGPWPTDSDDHALLWLDDGQDPLSQLLSDLSGSPAGKGDPRSSCGPTQQDVIDLRRGIPQGGGRTLLQARLGDRAGALGASARAFLHEPAVHGSNVESLASNETDTSTDPPQRPASPGAALPEQASASSPKSRRGRGPVSSAAPESLVRDLLACVDRLFGVRETADAVAGHLRETVGVDAVAVLVPDGPVWTVVGATGHRHLEERMTVTADHWLVQEVTQAHHGVVIEDTDIARSRLAGAPLAAWPRLMAFPLTEVQGMVLLARPGHGPAFTAHDLTQTAGALAEADGMFAAAVQLRELARRLRTFADLDEVHPVQPG